MTEKIAFYHWSNCVSLNRLYPVTKKSKITIVLSQNQQGNQWKLKKKKIWGTYTTNNPSSHNLYKYINQTTITGSTHIFNYKTNCTQLAVSESNACWIIFSKAYTKMLWLVKNVLKIGNSTNDVALSLFWCTNNEITNNPLDSETAYWKNKLEIRFFKCL